MSKLLITIISIQLIVLWSCTEPDKSKSIEELKIDISKVEKLDNFYSNISSYEFITLQQDSLLKLGEINKIIFCNEYIYVSDIMKSKGIFIYDKTGKLISTINRMGRGTGEYSEIRDFNIDKLTNDIYILDPQLRKMLIYNSKGVFVRDIKLGFIALTFLITDKYLIFDKFNMMERNKGENFNNNLLICDREGKIINGFLPIDKDLSAYSMGPINGLIENSNSIISYLPPINSNIYYFDLTQNKLVHQLHIDFGKNWPSNEFFRTKIHPAKMVKIMAEKKLVNFLNYSENYDFICLGFYHGIDKIIGFVSKDDHTYNFYYANEAPFELLPLSTDGNGNFVNVIYPEIVEKWDQLPLSVPDDIKKNKSIVLFKYYYKIKN